MACNSNLSESYQKNSVSERIKNKPFQSCLVVQCLGLQASTVGGWGFISGQRTKIPLPCSSATKKIKIKNKKCLSPLKKKKLFVHLFILPALDLSCGMWDPGYIMQTVSCSMWDLVL